MGQFQVESPRFFGLAGAGGDFSHAVFGFRDPKLIGLVLGFGFHIRMPNWRPKIDRFVLKLMSCIKIVYVSY